MQLRDLRDLTYISEETSLISLLGDVAVICKSTLFEMSLRRCMRRLKDESDMHPCRIGKLSVLKENNCREGSTAIFYWEGWLQQMFAGKSSSGSWLEYFKNKDTSQKRSWKTIDLMKELHELFTKNGEWKWSQHWEYLQSCWESWTTNLDSCLSIKKENISHIVYGSRRYKQLESKILHHPFSPHHNRFG